MESRCDNSFVVVYPCNDEYIEDKWHDAFLRSYKQHLTLQLVSLKSRERDTRRANNH